MKTPLKAAVLGIPLILTGCSLMPASDNGFSSGGCALIGAAIGAGAGGAAAGAGGAIMGALSGSVLSQYVCGDEPILDSDQDGVPDDVDQCPDTQPGVVVDNTGCPIDSDGDGFIDSEDSCPNQAGVAPDGCPATAEPTPEPEPVPVSIVENIHFEFDRARLTEIGKTTLDGRILPILRERPDVRVTIVGHTDSIGSESYNQRLSERRAASVRDYLVSHGIDASRLSVEGRGEAEPISENSTRAGRAANRRVEFQIIQ